MMKILLLAVPLLAYVTPSHAFDYTTLKADVDITWLVTAAALVLFMQIGFAFLESGTCRTKNSVNIMMKNFVDLSICSLAFWCIGYGLMFGENPKGLFGSSHFMITQGTDKEFANLLFQMMFAATAVTITSGAMAERTRFLGYIASAILITAFVYPIAGSWVWGSLYNGQGWLAEKGFIDFAGASVVHSIGGWVALAGVIVLGPRIGRFDQNGKPTLICGHNITQVGIGAMILWVGWFGFNGGSAGEASASIGKIVLNTHLAASAGLMSMVVWLKVFKEPLLITSAVNGALGGLVSITAGAASMDPIFAIISGFIGGFIVLLGSKLLLRLKIDDVVGAIPVHAFCGVWGTLAAGAFYNQDLFSIDRIMVQFWGCLAIFFWAFLTALLVYFIIDMVFGLRVDSRAERRGLDYAEHYEVAYPEFTHVITHETKK